MKNDITVYAKWELTEAEKKNLRATTMLTDFAGKSLELKDITVETIVSDTLSDTIVIVKDDNSAKLLAYLTANLSGLKNDNLNCWANGENQLYFEEGEYIKNEGYLSIDMKAITLTIRRDQTLDR